MKISDLIIGIKLLWVSSPGEVHPRLEVSAETCLKCLRIRALAPMQALIVGLASATQH